MVDQILVVTASRWQDAWAESREKTAQREYVQPERLGRGGNAVDSQCLEAPEEANGHVPTHVNCKGLAESLMGVADLWRAGSTR